MLQKVTTHTPINQLVKKFSLFEFSANYMSQACVFLICNTNLPCRITIIPLQCIFLLSLAFPFRRVRSTKGKNESKDVKQSNDVT
jgi:hypothetical protein